MKKKPSPSFLRNLSERLTVIATTAFAVAFGTSVSAQTLDGLDLGSAADYAMIHTGDGKLGWNSGPIAGDVLLGDNLEASLSGGNSGGLSNGGVLKYDNTVSLSGSLENPPPSMVVSTAQTQDAIDSAEFVSFNASNLTATQTFGTIDGTSMIFGNGGLNVIDIVKLKNAELTLKGGVDDYFIFNVSESVDTNKEMTLSGGIDASRILWNLEGSGTVFKTSGGNRLYGTFLSTNGGDFQFSSLDLNGALINTGGGNMQFVSGSEIPTFTSFSVPEPSSFVILILSIMPLLTARRRQLK